MAVTPFQAILERSCLRRRIFGKFPTRRWQAREIYRKSRFTGGALVPRKLIEWRIWLGTNRYAVREINLHRRIPLASITEYVAIGNIKRLRRLPDKRPGPNV
jgi:hypothetical protein